MFTEVYELTFALFIAGFIGYVLGAVTVLYAFRSIKNIFGKESISKELLKSMQQELTTLKQDIKGYQQQLAKDKPKNTTAINDNHA